MKACLHKSRQQLDTMSVSTVKNVGFKWLKYLTLITDSWGTFPQYRDGCVILCGQYI